VAVKEFVLPDSHDHFSRAEYLKVPQEFRYRPNPACACVCVCAILTPKNLIRSEVSLLSGLDHENIVRLVGTANFLTPRPLG
jgi:hypothetical protein